MGLVTRHKVADPSVLEGLRTELADLEAESAKLEAKLVKIRQESARATDNEVLSPRDEAEQVKQTVLGRAGSVKALLQQKEAEIKATPPRVTVPPKQVLKPLSEDAVPKVEAAQEEPVDSVTVEQERNKKMHDPETNDQIEVRREILKIQKASDQLDLGEEAVAEAIQTLLRDPEIEKARKQRIEDQKVVEEERESGVHVSGFDAWKNDPALKKERKVAFRTEYPKGSLPEGSSKDKFKEYTRDAWEALSAEDKAKWVEVAKKQTQSRVEAQANE